MKTKRRQWAWGLGLLLVCSCAHAAGDCVEIVWCDDFDAYAVDELVIGQDCGVPGCPDDEAGCADGLRWSSWDEAGAPVDQAIVVRDPARTGHVVEVEGLEDLVHELVGLDIDPGQVYLLSMDVYVPSAFDAQTGANWSFALLNTYAPNGAKNWSTQLRFDADAGVVVSDFDQSEIPYETDTWMPMAFVIILPEDRQLIRFNGREIDKGVAGWTHGVSGGGSALDLEAINLYAYTSDVPVYIDNLALCTVPPVGACCFDDGSCAEAEAADCDLVEDGRFRGVGSSCAFAACAPRGPDGWVVAAPFGWAGDTEDRAFDDCDFGGGVDDRWLVTVPWAQKWTFATCAGTAWDSSLYLGDAGSCSANVGVGLDGCPEGEQARLSVELAPGTYDLALEGATPEDAGPFELDVDARCPRLDFTGDEIDEGEPCGEETNVGCCSGKDEPMTPLACGDTIRGTLWHDGSRRDCDWYVFEVREDTEIRILGDSVVSGVFFSFYPDSQYDTCELFRVESATSNRCAGRRARVDVDAPHTDNDGGDPETTRWFVSVLSSFAGPVQPCDPDDPFGQNGYLITLQCRDAVCPADFDDSGGVGFEDLLDLLAQWGPCPRQAVCPWDLDDNDAVGFGDLVAVLAGWGTCP